MSPQRRDTIASLTAEYAVWLDNENRNRMLPAKIGGSADELLTATYEQRHDLDGRAAWLKAFCLRWDAAQEADSDDSRFQTWRATRKWWHDLRDSPVADENVTGPGYEYQGFYICLNTGPKQELGRYWTVCPFDIWGDLETCERALWAEHGADIRS